MAAATISLLPWTHVLVLLICFCCSAVVAWFPSLQKDHRDTTGLPYLFLLLGTLVGRTWKFSVVLQRPQEVGVATTLLQNKRTWRTFWGSGKRIKGLALSLWFFGLLLASEFWDISIWSPWTLTPFISYEPLEQTVSNWAPSQLLSTHRPLQITAHSSRKRFCTSQNLPEVI